MIEVHALASKMKVKRVLLESGTASQTAAMFCLSAVWECIFVIFFIIIHFLLTILDDTPIISCNSDIKALY